MKKKDEDEFNKRNLLAEKNFPLKEEKDFLEKDEDELFKRNLFEIIIIFVLIFNF